jgi:hypothetical protein
LDRDSRLEIGLPATQDRGRVEDRDHRHDAERVRHVEFATTRHPRDALRERADVGRRLGRELVDATRQVDGRVQVAVIALPALERRQPLAAVARIGHYDALRRVLDGDARVPIVGVHEQIRGAALAGFGVGNDAFGVERVRLPHLPRVHAHVIAVAEADHL